MTQKKVPDLIVSLAVPTIISMMVMALYNIADAFFVSKLGTSAVGAVGIVFSLMALIQSTGFMVGMGAGSILSRLLGKQNYKDANTITSTGFFLGVTLGFLITIAGIIFLQKLMVILGATPTIMPYAKDYAKFILLGAPIMCASFLMNNLLRAQGKALLSMIGLGTGAVINVFLAPLFIFVLKLGISGAAIATLISMTISFFILLYMFVSKKSIVKLHVKYISTNIKTYFIILKTGFPSFCRQGLASIAAVALNLTAARYGDAAVAAMSIVNRILMVAFSFMIGFGQGFQPVLGFNYGAKLYMRVKEAFNFTFFAGTIALTIFAIVGFAAAPNIIKLFRADDIEVIAIGTIALRAQCLSLPFQALIVVCNMTFQVLGQSLKATFLSSARQGLFFLPLIIILPHTLGLFGLEITQTCADLLSFLVAIPFAVFFIKDLNKRMKKEI